MIARSNEAKAFDIKMGSPYHEMKQLILRNGVKAFLSNYTLYGAMSVRMMNTFATFSPDVEVYSIDECFLELDSLRMSLRDISKHYMDRYDTEITTAPYLRTDGFKNTVFLNCIDAIRFSAIQLLK